MNAKQALAVLGIVAVAGMVGYVLGRSGPPAATDAVTWDGLTRISHAVSEIVFPISAQEGAATAEALARLAHAKVMAGADFAEVAAAQSKAPSAGSGGFLGWVSVDRDSNFAGAVTALSPGQISMPVMIRDGWHIIKRHRPEEAALLERRTRIPTHGFFVDWSGRQEGQPKRSRKRARDLAEQALRDIKAGKVSLEEAARLFAPPKEWRPDAWVGMTTNTGDLRPIYAALEKASEGEIVGPVSTPYGWGVLRRGRHMRALVKHILVQHIQVQSRDLRNSRSPVEARKVAERALAEALADPSRWDDLVARYSEDLRSRNDGGTLGYLHPGEMPPGFHTFAYDLKPGQIHEGVVETPLGFHVVMRVN